MSKKIYESNLLLKNIIESINNLKGKDIISLDLRGIESSIFKYFIICTGNSNIHVNAIQKNITKNIANKLKEKPWHVEGEKTSDWILIDYSDIIVHIFQENIRQLYKLEELWGDAIITHHKIS